jgi:hypothetical protein
MDGGIDATDVDAGPCPGDDWGFEPSNFDDCDILPLTGDLNLTPASWQINTDDNELRDQTNGGITELNSILVNQPDGITIRVLSVSSFTLASGASVRILGSRPLVIVAANDITISGLMSAGASGTSPGSGGGLAGECTSGTGTNGASQQDDNANTGGIGGGGGGYGAAGGSGAAVANTSASGVAGGAEEGAVALVPLRGGCSGGSGGFGGGAGGAGGGAVQLVAGGTITLSDGAQITARGGGGRAGSASSSGGGGGGSGGAVLIESVNVTVDGVLTAQGGSGGEGADFFSAGQNGRDGRHLDDTAAAGGNGLSLGGDGGSGGVGGGAAGPGSQGPGDISFAQGGGGGGGAVGRIRITSPNSPTFGGNSVVSPAAQ